MGNFTEKKICNFSQNVCIHNTKKKSEISFVTSHPKPLLFVLLRFYKPAFPRELFGKKGTRAKIGMKGGSEGRKRNIVSSTFFCSPPPSSPR